MFVETRTLRITGVEVFSYSEKANPAPQAIVLVGLPGSGKSTFRREKLLSSLRFRARSFAIYSTDDYLEEMALAEGKSYQWAFEHRFKEAKKYAQEALDIGLSYGCDLIFDQTNLTESKRASILAKLPHTYSRSCVYFEPTYHGQHEAMLASRKDKVIAPEVIESMRKQYVRPHVGEGWDALANYWDTAVIPAIQAPEVA